jgi:hypothetical protein
MIADDTLPMPGGVTSCTLFFNNVYCNTNFSLTKGGTAVGVVALVSSKVNSSAAITFPAGWTVIAYNTFIRGNVTNNGTFSQRGSWIGGTFTNAGTWTCENKSTMVGYTPAILANWSNVTPTSVANALDRIAAAIGPIP